MIDRRDRPTTTAGRGLAVATARLGLFANEPDLGQVAGIGKPSYQDLLASDVDMERRTSGSLLEPYYAAEFNGAAQVMRGPQWT